MQAFPYGEDPATWQSVVRQGLQQAELLSGSVGIEPRQLRVLELRLLEGAAPELQLASGDTVVAGLRMSKDSAELTAMRRAAEIAQNALKATLPMIKAGLTERTIAAELTLQGCPRRFGWRNALQPHRLHRPQLRQPARLPSERKLAEGDLLVIDWGAAYDGYFSDITRTFAIGKVGEEEQRIHQMVQQANAAGRAVGKPGAACEAVDQAARSVIEAAGYGVYFTHRTGHGLGMEGHEDPYMRSGNRQLLQVGMTYTVEPGVIVLDRA